MAHGNYVKKHHYRHWIFMLISHVYLTLLFGEGHSWDVGGAFLRSGQWPARCYVMTLWPERIVPTKTWHSILARDAPTVFIRGSGTLTSCVWITGLSSYFHCYGPTTTTVTGTPEGPWPHLRSTLDHSPLYARFRDCVGVGVGWVWVCGVGRWFRRISCLTFCGHVSRVTTFTVSLIR